MGDDPSAPNLRDYDDVLRMTGRRVADGTPPVRYLPGDYGRFDGVWYVRAPDQAKRPVIYNLGQLGAVSGHTVTEHDDGTITVAPSIVAQGWHGWLERGVWRSVDA